MAATDTTTSTTSTPNVPAIKQPTLPMVLSGADTMIDGKLHTGVTVQLNSGSDISEVVIPDITEVKAGTKPVFITNPIILKGDKLQGYLNSKGISTDISDKVKGVNISCKAFYYTTNDGPLLMYFNVGIEGGLIQKLTGSQELSDLLDVTGVTVRLLRCDEDGFEKLKDYANSLAD